MTLGRTDPEKLVQQDRGLGILAIVRRWRCEKVNKNSRLWAGIIAAFGAVLLAGCGGSSSSPNVTPPTDITQNPLPSLTSISPTSIRAGSTAFNLIVSGSNFISGSIVQWGGYTRTTTYLSATRLSAAIPATDLTTPGSFAITVYNPTPGGGTSSSLFFNVTTASPISILTASLPAAQHNKLYDYTLSAGGGTSPYSWSVLSGSLPDGLTLTSGGRIFGTPPVVSADTKQSFAVQVADAASQQASRSYDILLHAAGLGRNDTCGTANSIANGTVRASISPYGDIDVFSFQGTAGKTATIETYAQRLTIYGNSASRDIYLDTFLELLDSSCNRLTYNDDIDPGINQDSLISNYTLPYTGTYYIRVSDLRMDGRPDFIYELRLSGAN
jgi:hypothetical protein